MNALVNAFIETENKSGLTENGAKTFKSSLSANLDLFFAIGSPALESEKLIQLFSKAYVEDDVTALKILLWSRDCRGGAGIRKNFITVCNWLATKPKRDVRLSKILQKIPELGRWDDMLKAFHHTPMWNEVVQTIKNGIAEGNGLLCKWLPRKKLIAHDLRIGLDMSPHQYRKTIVALSKTVEQQMCANQWNEIKYETVPSVAFARNTNAFSRHDESRFQSFLERVENGETEINASVVFPHDIVRSIMSHESNTQAADLQWQALPDYLNGTKEKILVMADVSGSMNSAISGSITALHVCISLAIYFSERLKGAFKDTFLTFSSTPVLQKLQGTLSDRIYGLEAAEWGMSTDLELAFETLLTIAKTHKVAKSQMPTTILIMSDMEFNRCTSDITNDVTNYEMLEAKYKAAKYTLPKVVFWNLGNSRTMNVPVIKSQKNTALISGFSPAILTSVLNSSILDPVTIMQKTLNSPRYEI